LIANSYLVGAYAGRSAGFSPARWSRDVKEASDTVNRRQYDALPGFGPAAACRGRETEEQNTGGQNLKNDEADGWRDPTKALSLGLSIGHRR
jgi:hypothetical protein